MKAVEEKGRHYRQGRKEKLSHRLVKEPLPPAVSSVKSPLFHPHLILHFISWFVFYSQEWKAQD